MAKRLARSTLDWKGFADFVLPQDLGHFQSLKARSDAYVARVQKLPEALPGLDWVQYKTRAPALAAVIDKFEAQYKAAQVPYPATPDVLGNIDKQQQDHAAKTQEFLKESAVRLEEHKKGLGKWEMIPPVDHMTMQEWMYYFPKEFPDHKLPENQYFIDEDTDWDDTFYQSDYRKGPAPGRKQEH